jgi:hypothetical protein
MIFLHRQNDPKNIVFKNIDGIEIDIRSLGSHLIVNHDRFYSIDFENIDDCVFLQDVAKYLKDYTVIVNVKESGLEEQISNILDEYGSIKYYFLDSQIPDIIRLSKQNKYRGKFIIRVSDYETLNYKFLAQCKPEFIWVDYNFDNFNILDYIKYLKEIDSNEYLNKNGIKKILVSPELYGLQNINITKDIIKVTNKELLNRYSVCTKISEDWRKNV